MDDDNFRPRGSVAHSVLPAPNMAAGISVISAKPGAADWHPSGKKGHGRLVQVLRGAAFAVFFAVCVLTIQATQYIGVPLYYIDQGLYYSYMAVTKEMFGLVMTTMTYWWGPTTIRISGDASVAGQITKTPDGRVEFSFPDRIVMIANHQIYTDWLYLWWVGYANAPQMHGHIYIILKESLRWIPIIGQGMWFYGFIFMSRKMAADQPRMAHRLEQLSEQHIDPEGRPYHDPMWLLLFPEGTNLSGNGRRKSAAWAKKMGYVDPEHVLLPRSTGMFFCLNKLRDTVDYVYDCTVAYEGIPRGKYGEELFTLSGTYFQGRPPKSVNFHWRRFKIADIPLKNAAEFDAWMRERWYEKDAIMEQYLTTGRMPASPHATGDGQPDYIETEVRTRHPWELAKVFSIVGTVWAAWRIGKVLLRRFL